MIVMNTILKAATEGAAMYHNLLLGGLVAGIAIGLSALMQGRAGAGASDALAETGKGFVNYLMVLGVIETVALFVMVFITRAVT
jgi:V/A-type H+-transporting ATPase subunit K